MGTVSDVTGGERETAVKMRGERNRILRLKWRQRPKWRLIRWQREWALLIALPPLARDVRYSRTLGGIKIDGEICLLTTEQVETCWQPVSQLRGQWWIRLPLPFNWRLSGPPKTVHAGGCNWLLLPIQPFQENLLRQ